MNTERLKILSAALRADAAKPTGIKFDLSMWGLLPTDTQPTISCNTVACAVGLATLLPEFQAQGLGHDLQPSFEHEGHSFMVPLYEGFRDWEAVEMFFEIGPRTAQSLFCQSGYEVCTGAEAEIAVADQIDALLLLHPED